MKQKVLLVTAVIFGLLAMYLTHDYLKKERNKLRARTKRVHLIKMKTSLSEDETITQSDIAEFVNSERSNVSKHLSVMVKAGVLSSRKDGLKVIYTLKRPCIFRFLGCITECLQQQHMEDEEVLKAC